ncbi:MAG TPA: hypothetical protein VJ774_00620 [Actinomycetota bacterium]|nr:hypothetical protein [Actinomycetota bacterium]
MIDEAVKSTDVALVGVYTLIGAAAFTFGDWWLARRGGGDRKDTEGAQASGAPLAIVLGSVLDGIPESFALGLTVLQGGVSVALLIGVLLSNLPEEMSSPSGLCIAGWPRARVMWMWLVVLMVSAASAAPATRCSTRRPDAPAPPPFAAGALSPWSQTPCCPRPSKPKAFRRAGWWQSSFAISIILSAV